MGKLSSEKDGGENSDQSVRDWLADMMANFVVNTAAARSEKTLRGPFEAERWFEVDGCVSVFQTPVEPPRFIILSNYPALRQVLSDLGVPENPRTIYYSCFVSGGDYANATGEAYKKSQLFTVELFGRFLNSTFGEDIERELPIWRRPMFWNDATGEEIAIWRTRVYSQPLADLDLRPSQPMSPYVPCFPYLETRWHPDRDRKAFLLGGLEGFTGGFSLLRKFFRRASSILDGSPARFGRPPLDPMEFYKTVVRACHELWIEDGEKPGQARVALRLNISDEVFDKRWAKTNRRWADIPPPSDLPKRSR